MSDESIKTKKKMAGNSRAACCRLEFINERKSDRKIQSYQAGLVDLSWVWVGLAIKRAGFNSVSVNILVMVFLGIGKLGVENAYTPMIL